MIETHPDFEKNRKNALKAIENNTCKMPAMSKIFARQNCLEFRFNTETGTSSQIVSYNMPEDEFTDLANLCYKNIKKPKETPKKSEYIKKEYVRECYKGYPSWHTISDMCKNNYTQYCHPENKENT